MKRLLSAVMIVTVLASALLFNVGKAQAASYPTLTATRYVIGKEIVFAFEFNVAKLRGPNLRNASLYLHGATYPLACTVNKDNGTIICIAQGGLSKSQEAGVLSLCSDICILSSSLPCRNNPNVLIVVLAPTADSFGFVRSQQTGWRNSPSCFFL